MLLLNCPYCGPRAEIEFRNGGEAQIARPSQPSALSDDAWSEFLFIRSNDRGVHAERWNHAYGCQRWFNALRDTVTDRIIQTYRVGERPLDRASDETSS